MNNSGQGRSHGQHEREGRYYSMVHNGSSQDLVSSGADIVDLKRVTLRSRSTDKARTLEGRGPRYFTQPRKKPLRDQAGTVATRRHRRSPSSPGLLLPSLVIHAHCKEPQGKRSFPEDSGS
jgi:hypothetical protein